MANPSLTIDIGASTKAYDRAIKQVGDKADDALGRIESKFEAFDPQINTQSFINSMTSMVQMVGQLGARLGVAAGAFTALGAAAAAVGAVTALTVKLNAVLGETQDTAERAGLTLEKYQELKFGANSIGVGDDQFNASVENFATNLQNAKFQANDLTRQFQANGVALTDSNGKLKDQNALIGRAVDIVQRQGSALDAIQVGGFFGFSKEFSQAIFNAGTGFQNLASQARAAGAVIDDEVFKKADEFNKEWNVATTKWGTDFKSSLQDILPMLNDAVSGALSLISAVGKVYSYIKSIRNDAATQNAANGEIGVFGSAPTTESGPQKVIVTGGQTDIPLPRSRPDSAPQTKTAVNAGPKIDQTRDAYDRATEAVTKYIATTEAEAATVGQSIDAIQAARTAAQLLAAAQKAGIPITQQLTDEIRNQGAAAGQAALDLAKAKIAEQISQGSQSRLLSPEDVALATQLKDIYPNVAEALGSVEAQALRTNQALSGVSSQVSGDLTSGLLDITTGTKSVKDGFSDMAQSIIKDIEQMIIKLTIVQPLMRALQSSFGGVGDFIGSGFNPVAGITGAYASGTNYAPGGLALVGENGPEIVNLPRGSQVVPNSALNSAGTVSPNLPTISRSNGNGGVTIINQTSQPATASAQQDGNGNLQIVLRDAVRSIIGDDASRSGPITRTMRGAVTGFRGS